MVSEKFDPDGRITAATAKKRSISEAELKAEWKGVTKDSQDHGIRIHNAIEKFQKEMIIQPEDADLTSLVTGVAGSYANYARIYCEKVVFSEEYGIAGTTDVMAQKTTSKDSIIDFSDHKTNMRKGIEYESKYRKFLYHPVDHLMHCNFNKYSLQLSMYALMYQLRTNCKIGKLWINFFPPEDINNWRIIPIPYMKHEAMTIFEWYKNQPKIEQSSAVQQIIYNEPAW